MRRVLSPSRVHDLLVVVTPRKNFFSGRAKEEGVLILGHIGALYIRYVLHD
jgi:hypothetical protein